MFKIQTIPGILFFLLLYVGCTNANKAENGFNRDKFIEIDSLVLRDSSFYFAPLKIMAFAKIFNVTNISDSIVIIPVDSNGAIYGSFRESRYIDSSKNGCDIGNLSQFEMLDTLYPSQKKDFLFYPRKETVGMTFTMEYCVNSTGNKWRYCRVNFNFR